MMKRSALRATAVLLSVSLLLLSACAGLPGPGESREVLVGSSRDLMEGITATPAQGLAPDETFRLSQLNFALALARETAVKDKNLLLSPFSVMIALAMTQNGARGTSLSQMEQVLGSGIPAAQMNRYLYAWISSLPDSEDARLQLADSLWIKESSAASVVPSFLQTNADWYGADAYTAPFDEGTLADINSWVASRTEGMIPKLMDRLSPDTEMILLNALAFDALWRVPYTDALVRTRDFRNASGKTVQAAMMHSTESSYLEGKGATGFLKYYADARYAFAAVLPDKGVSPADYLASLTASDLDRLLSSPVSEPVSAVLPQFSYSYEEHLPEALQRMGMTQAFSGSADFSGMLPGAFISDVLHKTFIEVTQAGTRAAAVTAVEMTKGAAPAAQKEVVLDRPFLYMIVDTEYRLPIFIGIVNELP